MGQRVWANGADEDAHINNIDVTLETQPLIPMSDFYVSGNIQNSTVRAMASINR